jgi:outer membrane protein assembly factor BamB
MMDGVYTEQEKETFTWYGYDIYLGPVKWGPTEPTSNIWGLYWQGTVNSAYGYFYWGSYDGEVHAYNMKTGERVWDYSTGNSGLETPYGTYPVYNTITVADGKVYAPTSEHSLGTPIWRGEKLHCIDAYTGKGIWSITGVFQGPIIADGYMLTLNAEDNQIYCFGKGQTATTVSAPTTVVENGSKVLIQGTITDQSPGQAGTPCVSAKSMSQWMEYLHMQKPQPTNTTGVPVQLLATTANGTTFEIGTVKSDTGGFRYSWTPPDEGLYTITAYFAGDDSYGSSWASTGLSVGPTPTAPAPAEEAVIPDYTPMFAGIIVAVAIAIVIGLVNLFWKRK